MEKKDLLAVRKKLPAAAAKRRRKVVTPAEAGARGLAKVIAAYLASDSYMYAPLVSAPPAHPPPPPAPSVAPSISTPAYGLWKVSFAVTKLAPKPKRGKSAKNEATNGRRIMSGLPNTQPIKSEKEVTLVQKYRGSLQATFTAY